MSKHTPVPWVFIEPGCVMAANGCYIKLIGGSEQRPFAPDEQKANAAFIVRACNAHQDLVDALGQLSAALEDYDFDPALQAAARAAIAKAEQRNQSEEKKYIRFAIDIPHGLDVHEVIQMFNRDGIFVDDMCAASKDGRAVNLWIPKSDTLETDLGERCGSFWGAQPEEKKS